MKAYKAFNNKLQCTPNGKAFQYEIGKTYEENGATLCKNGFHACERPLDIFSYYAPANSRFCEVDVDGVSEERKDDTKISAKKIAIKAELNIPLLCKAQFEYVKSHTTTEFTDEKQATAGYSGAATAGYRGAATAGEYGAATAGEYGAATAGYSGAATAGEYGFALSGGSASVGESGVAVAKGTTPKAKGGIGATLVLIVTDDYGQVKKVIQKVVDGQKVKADTFYTFIKGKFAECEEPE